MKKGIKRGIKILILLFCIFLAASYSFAAGVDISISDIVFPAKIYLRGKTSVEIIVSNNSDADLKDCMVNIEASDGSKASQTFVMSKNEKQKIVVKWVPLCKGKIDFQVKIAPPTGIQETNTENNQVTKTIEVLAR